MITIPAPDTQTNPVSQFLAIDAAGNLHQCEDAHMVDDEDDFQNTFLDVEQLQQWFHDQANHIHH